MNGGNMIECEDAISRQAAIDAIKEIHPIDTEYDCTLYDKIDVIYVLKDLPSVNLQPKTGHWISYWDEEARCYVYKCPECGNKQPFDTKHCWECGTKLSEISTGSESEET